MRPVGGKSSRWRWRLLCSGYNRRTSRFRHRIPGFPFRLFLWLNFYRADLSRISRGYCPACHPVHCWGVALNTFFLHLEVKRNSMGGTFELFLGLFPVLTALPAPDTCHRSRDKNGAISCIPQTWQCRSRVFSSGLYTEGKRYSESVS